VTRTAVYTRISSDPSGLRAGVERQRQDCQALADRRGWEVVEVYEDNDASATNGKPRPSYQRLLADLGADKLEAVVVWSLDRLHRRPAELEEFIDLADRHRVALASVAGDINLGTPEGRLHARIMGSVAAHEGDVKRRRVLRKMQELAEQGKANGGGNRPFGYLDNRVEVDQVEAELVREAAARVLAGSSLRSIVADWNRREITTSTGRPWQTGVLRRLLLSARIAGLREHRGAIAGTAVWPAIITPDDHDRLRAVLTDAGRAWHHGSVRSHLLTGFIYCGICGEKLVARPRSAGVRGYCCSSGPPTNGCGKISRLAELVEAEVTGRVLVALDSPGFTAALQRAQGDDHRERLLLDRLRVDQASLDQLAVDHVTRIIGRSEWLAARAVLEGRLEAARRDLARTVGSHTLATLPSGGAALRKAWAAADLDWRRAVLGAVVERVTLQPARRGINKFDPSKIAMTWRA
jgi:DNA invertase Pin-like site-specific DNA recombinase